jgi:outer membrane protein insertion porin family
MLVAPAFAQPASRDSLFVPGRSAPAFEGQRFDSLPPEPRGPIVGAISVRGNVATDSARILRTFEVAPGSRFREEAIRHGIRKLFALQIFDDIRVERIPAGARVDLVIHVQERPRIASIGFTGNQKRETVELERKLFLRPGGVYSPTAVQTQIDSLLRYYRDEGFPQATITAATDSAAGGQIAIRFDVKEGERVKITAIVFEGVTAFPEGRLRKQMKTKKRGIFGGGDIKEESFAEDQAKLEAWYHNHGYRDMRYLGNELVPGDGPRRITLRVKVEEGTPYRFGAIQWAGNTIVDDPTLERLWPRKGGDLYDASRIERAQGAAYGEYAERGYLLVNIDAQETVRGDTVDVTFSVTEGQPSNVRAVLIQGNKSTREKVIRREIAIHEGERFKRSALQRTQGDIFRLGLFEDVQIELAPTESTDVDIVLKVKEKQVGTASAGAGYTSESGLTGFLELGHNNVLGNGQALSLHLERGGRRSDYYLSFTEPWFRDTPTLLGFTAFNTERERDLYTEKRVGGSGRIGRPLPWPDYSRGSLSYRLEEVTIRIDKPDELLTPQDSLVLAGLRNGEGVLTSSMETNFSRNSTDNPFYPTRGTRLTLNHELAGGPFGGHVHFHKHRLEGRAYMPSLFKGITTMFRGRVGMIGEYGDQTTPVPAYERFRLGGGSTFDPLRGYDDYEVVPEKFDRVLTSSDTLDATSPYDSVNVRLDNVRYPGGRFALTYSLEQQFAIVHPLHGVVFFDAGNTWDRWEEIKPWDLKLGLGVGFRLEIPLLGNIGFDYAYGFQHEDFDPSTGRKKLGGWKGHFLLGNVNF